MSFSQEQLPAQTATPASNSMEETQVAGSKVRPTKARTSYNFFLKEMMQVWEKQLFLSLKKKFCSNGVFCVQKSRNKEIQVPKGASEISFFGAKWKSLSAEDKRPYESLASADKQRFQTQIDVWTLNNPEASKMKPKKRKRGDTESQNNNKRRKKREEGRPKRGMSPYNIFMKQQHQVPH